MKNLRYIVFFLFLSFIGRSFGLPEHYPANISLNKENQHSKFKKNTVHLEDRTSGLNRKFRPKKPRGIQVIVPNISSIAFNKFCYHSNYASHEVKGTYSLLLHYSHGKRGPPAA